MNVNNKSELLQQLKIDRSDPEKPSGIGFFYLLLIVLVSVVLTAWLTLKYQGSVKVPISDLPTAQLSPTKPVENLSEKANSHTGTSDIINKKDQTILNSSGYITARRMATVSSEVMGLIKEVNVEEGMSVTKGQVLARLDDVLATANLDYANAQIDVLISRKNAIMANVDEAKRNYQRLMKNSFSSEASRTNALAQLQSLTANFKSADAEIVLAKIDIRRQKERLADHTIRAPFSGVVTVKNAQPGEIVSPASAGGGFTRTGICTIVDMSSLEIEVDVNESFIGRVFPGQTVKANLDAYPDWIIPASVIAIIPTADRAKATVQVRIKLKLSDHRILPDMGVKVAFLKE
ncbi:MAG: efflux RND transporter periplasmic adaptor subunit [Colwellia sp.]|nr:efflux RND transporter periplasmic adaptor subunit [Colwellia sp.]